MSKLDDVKGELPKIERTYQLDPETAITVREDGTWFEGTKKTQKGVRAHVVRLARSKIILDGMLRRSRRGTQRIETDTTQMSGPTRSASWPMVGGLSKISSRVSRPSSVTTTQHFEIAKSARLRPSRTFSAMRCAACWSSRVIGCSVIMLAPVDVEAFRLDTEPRTVQ